MTTKCIPLKIAITFIKKWVFVFVFVVALFAKLLMKIPDLRTLNTLHSEKLLGLSVPSIGPCKVPPPLNDKLQMPDGTPHSFFQG